METGDRLLLSPVEKAKAENAAGDGGGAVLNGEGELFIPR